MTRPQDPLLKLDPQDACIASLALPLGGSPIALTPMVRVSCLREWVSMPSLLTPTKHLWDPGGVWGLGSRSGQSFRGMCFPTATQKRGNLLLQDSLDAQIWEESKEQPGAMLVHTTHKQSIIYCAALCSLEQNLTFPQYYKKTKQGFNANLLQNIFCSFSIYSFSSSQLMAFMCGCN